MFSHIVWQMMAQSQGMIFTHQKGNLYVCTSMQREEEIVTLFVFPQ